MSDMTTPLKQVIESFLKHRHDLPPAANYRHQLDLFCGWGEGQLERAVQMADVGPGLVNAYLSYRTTAASARSAHAARTVLRSLAGFLAERSA